MRIHRLRTSLAIIGLGCLAVVALSTALLAAPPKGADMKVSASVTSPEIIAVRVYHDKCPYCKKLKRDLNDSKLGTAETDRSVLFVTLDMSSEASQRQSALLMGALGLESVWPLDLSTVGTVTFVEWKSKRIVSSVRAFDVKTIRAAVRDAVASVGG